MFVFKSKYEYEALMRVQAEHSRDMAKAEENQAHQRVHQLKLSSARYRREATQALQAAAHWQGRAERAEARLADLQKPKASAAAQAFDRIVREVDYSGLERRVTAHYALTAPYGGTMRGARQAVYEGHAGDSGIQRHSIGEEYPFIVYAEEFRGHLRWRIMDSRSGYTLVDKYGCAENASSRARGLKKYNLRINAQGHAYHKE